MNKFDYDLIIFALTLVCCFFYNAFLYKQPGYSSKKGFTYIIVFLAMYPLLNIVAHLIAVGWVALIRMQTGVFQYDFKFYTLVQFGILLLLINGYLLNRIGHISRGNQVVYRQIIIACLLQSAIVLPLFPFNPLSLLPVITSVLLVLSIGLALRSSRTGLVPGKSRVAETIQSSRYA